MTTAAKPRRERLRMRGLRPHLAVAYIHRAITDAEQALAEADLDALREALEDATDCAAFLRPSDLRSQVSNRKS